MKLKFSQAAKVSLLKNYCHNCLRIMLNRMKTWLTAARVKRKTDSLLAKCRSGSIFIILRIRVCGKCVSLARWSSSCTTEFSSFCELISVLSAAISSAILNLRLAGKIRTRFQSTHISGESVGEGLGRKSVEFLRDNSVSFVPCPSFACTRLKSRKTALPARHVCK